RATATLARRMPERFAMAMPQALGEDQRLVRVSRTFASAAVPRTVERLAGEAVALLADVAHPVRLARLVAPRRQPEVRPDRAGAAEPGWVIYGRAEGQCSHRSHTGHRHQPATD